MHLALCYVVLVTHQYDACKDSGGCVYGGLSELCPVSFLVVGESSLVLL